MSGVLGIRKSGRVLAAVVSLGLAAGFVTVGASAPAIAASPGQEAPPVVDAPSAADAAGARAIAQRFGHKVLIDSSVTSTNEVSALPDGSMQLTASSVPLRAKVGSAWKPIDLGLVSRGGYLVPAVSTQAVQFSMGGDGPLARVQDASGTWIDEGSPFGTLPEPSMNGSTATYADVLPGVDLQLTATLTGMSEVLIVKSAAAAANPALTAVRFGITGSAISSDGSGNVHAGAEGAEGVQAGTPLWWDSSQGSTAAGPEGTLIPQPAFQSVTNDSVTLDAGAAATSAGVQYPVFIDPDWSTGKVHSWFIDKGFPNQAYLDSNPYSTVEKSGWIPASATGSGGVAHTARAFWNFNLSALVGTVVSAAHLSVVLNGAFNCSIMRQANLRAVAGAPIGGTWNSSSGTYYGGVEGSAVPSGCGAAVGFTAMDSAGNAVAGATSQSMAILANSESDEYNWQKWNMGATFTATYDHQPNAPGDPQFVSPSRTCSTSASDPTFIDGTQPFTLGVVASDPDAGQALTSSFAIYQMPGRTYVWGQNTPYQAQGPGQVTVPANTLTTGGDYVWDSQIGDSLWASALSPDCYFRIVTASPGLPTVARTSTGTPVVGQPITVQFGSAASDGVRIFAFWWVASVSNVAQPPPALTPINPGDPLPACGSTSGPVTYVCPDAGSLDATGVAATPIGHLSTLWVASYNDAGRVSVNSGGTYAAAPLHVTATGPVGEAVNVGCDDLITPQEMYDFNPNWVSVGPWTPPAGTFAAQAVAWSGVACRWINETSSEPIDVSVASIIDPGTMTQLQADASAGAAVSGLGDSAYFEVVGGVGQLQIFDGTYWVTLSSPFMTAAGDLTPLPADVLAALP